MPGTRISERGGVQPGAAPPRPSESHSRATEATTAAMMHDATSFKKSKQDLLLSSAGQTACAAKRKKVHVSPRRYARARRGKQRIGEGWWEGSRTDAFGPAIE